MSITTLVLFGEMPALPFGTSREHTMFGRKQVIRSECGYIQRGKENRSAILDLLDDGASTISGIAEYLGISVASAKRHVEKLIELKEVAAIQPGSRGTGQSVLYQLAGESEEDDE